MIRVWCTKVESRYGEGGDFDPAWRRVRAAQRAENSSGFPHRGRMPRLEPGGLGGPHDHTPHAGENIVLSFLQISADGRFFPQISELFASARLIAIEKNIPGRPPGIRHRHRLSTRCRDNGFEYDRRGSRGIYVPTESLALPRSGDEGSDPRPPRRPLRSRPIPGEVSSPRRRAKSLRRNPTSRLHP